MKEREFTGKSYEMRKDSPWLSSEDILDAGDVLVTIEDIKIVEDAKFEDGRVCEVMAIKFVGKEKRLVVNNTNRKMLAFIAKTGIVQNWKGLKVVLYVDHNVRKKGGKAGERTFGIRIKAPH